MGSTGVYYCSRRAVDRHLCVEWKEACVMTLDNDGGGERRLEATRGVEPTLVLILNECLVVCFADTSQFLLADVQVLTLEHQSATGMSK
jgi:hypothetical protein